MHFFFLCKNGSKRGERSSVDILIATVLNTAIFLIFLLECISSNEFGRAIKIIVYSRHCCYIDSQSKFMFMVLKMVQELEMFVSSVTLLAVASVALLFRAQHCACGACNTIAYGGSYYMYHDKFERTIHTSVLLGRPLFASSPA